MAAVERLLDWTAVVAGVLLPFVINALRQRRQQTSISNLAVVEAAALFGFVVVLLLERDGEYRPYLSLLAVRETERLLRVGAECCLLAVPCCWLATPAVPKLLVLSCLLTVPISLVLEKTAWYFAVRSLRIAGRGRQRAVVLGGGLLAKNIYSVLLRSPKLGLDPVAIVDEEAAEDGVQFRPNSYWREKPALVLAGPLSDTLFRNVDASTLVIADPSLDNSELVGIARYAGSVGVSTYIVSRDYLDHDQSLEYCEVDGMMLGGPAEECQHKFSEIAKRCIDFVLAALALLLLAIPFAIISVFIRLDSPGPAIFHQFRVGRDGRLFNLFKFRSMFVGSYSYAFSPSSGLDSRITRVGRWLRRTCFDELPQLWNVLKGDMSLVGPRPEMPFIADQYNRIQRRRLSVKPGITGLWQLSGDRSRLIHENLEYDLYYLKHRSLFMDFAVILHSLVFAGRGI
jgi:exopolysaccharide biosynthesis polyprenyl glycosylphosphotransferase